MVLEFFSLGALDSLILDYLSSFAYSMISVISSFNLSAFLEIDIGTDPTLLRFLYYYCHVTGFLLKPIDSINSQ
jgi:hypothetical protein